MTKLIKRKNLIGNLVYEYYINDFVIQIIKKENKEYFKFYSVDYDPDNNVKYEIAESVPMFYISDCLNQYLEMTRNENVIT